MGVGNVRQCYNMETYTPLEVALASSEGRGRRYMGWEMLGSAIIWRRTLLLKGGVRYMGWEMLGSAAQ